ncbi:MAG: hypothetical protein IRD7MM_06350 [Candidatus Midichloria mitochondrii]|nr:lysophospholipid acyltransferase family protein [Candidatus Midichloria mitochondrii]MDJ1288418.1 lysophospholipid acyltransferase family protein [Candidatus Midichloria mitochondrii]MDJ1299265.1 lysophospholipid acyltransferase family protein [Candidatus Midichloria mitochondrii]MDJ1313408.1 lysophospholipid acyltransferase family protein [Candidatus Midichloria mitochondrii]MDJ1583982.1 lysophospholipid acyltransferase family protein [Candidatus Midichloria mitochondrii]
MKKRLIRSIKYFFLTLFLLLFFLWFAILPYRFASVLGGKLAQCVGSLLSLRNNVARKNLKIIDPSLSKDKIEKIIKQAWNNFGRIIAELTNLRSRDTNNIGKLVELIGTANLGKAVAANKPIIFVSAHYSNWEMLSLFVKFHLNLPLQVVYKKPPNILLYYLIKFLRRLRNSSIENVNSIRNIISLIKRKGYLGMIIDQKVIDGISVPFFGLESQTSTLTANLAIRYDCIILPARIYRQNPRHTFKLEFLPPINYQKTINDKEDVKNITTLINKEFEKWIKEKPEECLLFHRRWPNI